MIFRRSPQPFPAARLMAREEGGDDGMWEPEAGLPARRGAWGGGSGRKGGRVNALAWGRAGVG